MKRYFKWFVVAVCLFLMLFNLFTMFRTRQEILKEISQYTGYNVECEWKGGGVAGTNEPSKRYGCQLSMQME